MTPAQAYAEVIRESRRRQLRNDAEAVANLERLLGETASRVRERIIKVPAGIRKERWRRDLLASLETTLEQFRTEYKDLLDAGIIEAARLVEERERAGLEAILQHREALPPDQVLQLIVDSAKMTVQFGQVPQIVLERLYARTYRDGLQLSDRLHNLDQATRQTIQRKITEAIAEGKSARALASSIEPHLTGAGGDNVRYRAMRIARTEINVAYREGHIASITDDDGKLKPFVEAIGWRLSPAHPRVDICDAWAGDDNGLGPGNYLPDDVPPGHPHCLCFTVSILASLPQEQWVSKHADPEGVPEAQRRYYGLSEEADE